MSDTEHSPSEPPALHRRRWLTAIVVAAVLVAGIAVGIGFTNRHDTQNQASANSQVAVLNQACNNWLNTEPSATTPKTWCNDMTGWMNQQIANGSMNPELMWANPDQMLTTCRAWMNTNPSADRPNNWCNTAMAGLWQHMSNGWNDRGDWDNWMTDHPMMGG